MSWNGLLSKERLGSEIDIPYDQTKYAMSECNVSEAELARRLGKKAGYKKTEA